MLTPLVRELEVGGKWMLHLKTSNVEISLDLANLIRSIADLVRALTFR